MSSESAIVSAAHFGYVAEHTTREDDFLIELNAAAAEAGIPEIWIAPEQAAFLQILLRLSRAREVVEVGTLAGYSAITMARALSADGKVRTIEVNPKHADFAERWVARSDVAGRVEVLRGPGAEMLTSMADQSADAMFLDADKQSYPAYLAHALRILRPGGLLLVDNAFAFGLLLDPQTADPDVAAIRSFNDLVARTPQLQSVIVPLGDGCWVGVLQG